MRTGKYHLHLYAFLACFVVLCTAFLTLQSKLCLAQDDYSFDLEEFEGKPFEWGGYAELKYEFMDLNQDGLLYQLIFFKDPRNNLNRFTGTAKINGSYKKGKATFNWLFHTSGSHDEIDEQRIFDIYEAVLSIKASPSITFDLGKKVNKWGKGYAWNPVGFIDRPKDPNNPDEALEGYIGAGVDIVKSYQGPLQTAALTSIVLPVFEAINEDFGETDKINFAAKLYLLYKDTDLDFIFFTGNSRSTRYGVDFSRNITTNFEIHGELAYLTDVEQKYLSVDGAVVDRKGDSANYLLGLRYLSRNDVTSIFEFYHNDAGYNEEEMDRFFDLVSDATTLFQQTGDAGLIPQATALSKTYSRPYTGENYLYVKVSQKEPFDILYLTPGFTAICNLDDRSYTVSPEIVYTGFTNWELRLRLSLINGASFTENGEKQNSSKFEWRIRYFF
jgi:hypothetical protein